MKRILLLSFVFMAIVLNAQVTSLSEGFENFPFPPNGWDGDFGASPMWERTNSNPHSGSYSVQVGLGVLDPVEASLSTPEIDLSQSAAKNITFWYRYAYEQGGNDDSTFLEITTNGGVSWIVLDVIKATAVNSDVWTFYSYDLSAYATDVFQLRWRYVGEGMAAWQVQFDDITIGASNPSELSAAYSINQAGVSLSWQHPGGAEYKIYRSVDDVNYNLISTSLGNQYVDNTIEFNKQYYYKVSADYNGTETDKSDNVEVYIPGGDVVWLDDFESGSLSNEYTFIDEDAADAWVSFDYNTFVNTFEPFAWRLRSSQDETHFFCHSGIYSIGTGYNQNGSANDDWIILPQIHVEDTTYRFGFYAVSQDPSLKEAFEVLVSNTGSNISDFNVVYSKTSVSGRPNWDFYEFELDDYLNENIYIAIRCISNNKYVLIVDDIYVFKDGVQTVCSEKNPANTLSIYPNPNYNDKINIILKDNELASNFQLKVYDINGKTKAIKTISISKNSLQLSTANFAKGLYFIELINNGKKYNKSFVVN